MSSYCRLQFVCHSGLDPESSDFKGPYMDSGSKHCRNDRHKEGFINGL
jgi:hypothetical protein